MEIHYRIIGFVLMLLSIMHIGFPKYFNWSKELSALSLINRQMIHVHTFFIAFVLLLMGILCLTSSEDLVQTSLGKKISLGFGLFWTIRLFIQLFGYSPVLWKGKMFETVVHIIFSLIWTYLSIVFLTSYFT